MPTFIQNPPDARSLMEAARSFGNYDLASAIADLIDNSISAQARLIKITCVWNEGDPEIRVQDDGRGMDEDTLFQAMKPASANPTVQRQPDDLGRFGLGLKTASLSQCRSMTVISTKSGKWSGARWDLDRMNDWAMEVLSPSEIDALTELPQNAKSGTEVIWTKLDRLTEGGAISSDAFNTLIDSARTRLALVYQRFIAPEIGQRALKLEINGTLVRAFDPFHEKHSATQALSEETIEMKNGAKIVISPFILPHYSKMSSDEYESLAGEEGYLRNQGFYVYRNRRLIMNGTWFKLVRHGDLSKLARVRIDIPNTLDSEWKITVDKSGAQIPSMLRVRLQALIDRIRDYSGDVYRRRGATIDTQGVTTVWTRRATGGSVRYKVNRDHPLISHFSERLSKKEQREFEDILSAIETGFPIDTLFADAGDNPQSIAMIATEPEEIRQMTRRFIERFLANVGDRQALVAILTDTEPFRGNKKIVDEELERAGLRNG